MFEKTILKKKLGNENFNLLSKYNFIIGGGAITSIFTGKKINDFDVYARNECDVINFLKDVWGKNCRLICHTKKATLLKLNGVYIQLIYFKYYNNAEELFKTFDFTICMGAFDFADQKFHLHRKFLKHNSQRVLVFNEKTAFPVISTIRIEKYKKRDYKISNAEYFKVILACMSLKINTWEQLKEHLAGMYGGNLHSVFDSNTKEKFNLQRAMQLLSEEPTKVKNKPSTLTLDELIKHISGIQAKYFEFKEKTYQLHNDGCITMLLKEKEVNHVMLDIKDVFKDNLLYKFVKKQDDGTYSSFYTDEVRYCIGTLVKPISSKKFNGRIYVSKKEHIRKSHYYSWLDKVLVEIAYSHEDLLDIDEPSKITIAKGYVVREVPQEEWKKWESKV